MYILTHKAEASMIDHSREFAPNLEKCTAVQFFSCKKIDHRMTPIFLVILFLNLKLL
jgi:hypothetical protein